MGKALDFHPSALQEAEAAARWYAARSRQAAHQFLSELDQAILAVSLDPERYPRFIAGTRRFLLKRFPFFVVYHASSPGIQVVAVAHSRQRPGYWRERLR